jgi:hypothetical protein
VYKLTILQNYTFVNKKLFFFKTALKGVCFCDGQIFGGGKICPEMLFEKFCLFLSPSPYPFISPCCIRRGGQFYKNSLRGERIKNPL